MELASFPTALHTNMQHMQQQQQQQLQHQHHQQQLQQQQNEAARANLKSTIIHIRENSLDELEALFDPSKWLHRVTQKLPPLNKRNLPASFFRPPQKGTKTRLAGGHFFFAHQYGNHMRQTSHVDQSSHLISQQQMQQQQQHKMSCMNGAGGGGDGGGHMPSPNSPSLNGGPAASYMTTGNAHLRSASEPVSMSPLSYQMNGSGDHLAAHQQQQHMGAQLPYGWQAAKTADGQLYYVK
jgi:hypothetical protein